MIREYTREAGVRNLERNIGTLCRKVVKQQLEQGEAHKVSITAKNLKEYLGSAKYHNKELSKRSRVGLVHGVCPAGGPLCQRPCNQRWERGILF